MWGRQWNNWSRSRSRRRHRHRLQRSVSGHLPIARALEAPARAALALAGRLARERLPESRDGASAVVVAVGRAHGDLAVAVHEVAAREAARGHVEQHAVRAVAAETRPAPAAAAAPAVEHRLAAVELIVRRERHRRAASIVRQHVGLLV